MNKTPFSKRVEIMGDFYAQVCDDADIMSHPFLVDHSDTLWMCLASNVRYVQILDRYYPMIDLTWDAFCDYLGVDKYGEFDSFNHMMEIVNV